MSIRHPQTPAELTELLTAKSGALVVLFFASDFSAAGLRLTSTVEMLSKSWPHVTFAKMSLDKHQQIAERYGVNAPALVFLKNNNTLEKFQAADQDGLRAALARHAPAQPESEGVSLLEFIERPQLNCLNESTEHNLRSILSGHKKNTTPAYLESDADEQLLINIPFTQTVKIRAVAIKGNEAGKAPKLIKIAVNKPNLGFDELENAVEPAVAQIVELDAESVEVGKPIALRFVRFQTVTSIHFFVASNQGGEDETRIDSIDILGFPGQTSRVEELRAREEAH